MSYVEKVQGGSVNWGGVVAGAAVVTGAVLLAPSIMETETIGAAFEKISDKVATFAQDLGTKIAGFFTSTTPEVASTEPGLMADLGQWIKANGQALGGAALVGGGAAGLLKSSGETAYVVPASPIPAATHVENEQMRAISGLMKARMMAANPEYMAQAMGRV